MTAKLFSELGLSPEILKAVDKLGFEQASPIQAEAIPILLTGRDIVGQSQTGSGKTAAFGIPAIEKVDVTSKAVQVLILCPTRELAVQVSEEIHKLALFKRGIHALPIYGGQSYERQFMGLKAGAQIVIGTPGRVMDHMKRGTLRLNNVKLAILDEADVMLNMGFREDIEMILTDVPKERQTVFFSATMPPAIRQLIERFAREPQTVKIEQKTLTVANIEQTYYEVDRRFKMLALERIIDMRDYKLGIIFCNTKRMVDDLVDHLNAAGYSADRLHGDMTQHMRDRVMNKFRKSGLEFLVATDVAARGIDVDDVEVVFNYDLPYDVEDYVHRIGRTGRAGRKGQAISFVAYREFFQIRNIERYTNQRIQRGVVPSENQVIEAKDEQFITRVGELLASGEFEKADGVIERLLEPGHSSSDLASVLIHLLRGGAESSAKSEPSAPKSFAVKPAAAKPAPSKPAPAKAVEPKPAEAASVEATVEPAAQAATEAVPETPAETITEASEETAEEAAPVEAPKPAAKPYVKPPAKPYTPREPRPQYGERREYGRDERRPQYGDKPYGQKPYGDKPYPQRPYGEKPYGNKPYGDKPPYGQKPYGEKPYGQKPYGDKPSYGNKPYGNKPYGDKPPYGQKPYGDKPYGNKYGDQRGYPQDDRRGYPPRERKPAYSATPYDEAPPYDPEHKSEPKSAAKPTHAPAPKPNVLPVKKFPTLSSANKPLPAFTPKKQSPAPERTYSDEEILASVNSPPPGDEEVADAPKGKKKFSRATPPTHTRIWMSVGEAQGVSPIDVVNSVAGETGLPGKVVGKVDVREKHLFMDVASEHANAVISKLNRAEIKGHKVKVKLA